MDVEFKVVTSTAEIASLNEKLASRLRETFKHKESREVSYPSGHQTRDVFFEQDSGSNVRSWAPIASDDKLVNFLLYGKPHSTDWMEIEVQLNFPAGKYNRMVAGAFVTDLNGNVFVAHRGRLTKRTTLPVAPVLREFSPWLVEAADDAETSTLILIADLSEPGLVDKLFDFASEAREVAIKVGDIRDAEALDKPNKSTSRPSKPPVPMVRPGILNTNNRQKSMMKLRKYFDEYAGEGKTKGHGGGARIVEHGEIVKALEAALRSKGESQKSQAIDLAIVLADAVDLFEVKTSARTTDVYTGVGQLLIHGECIAEVLDLPVRRHLVLPCKPNAEHAKHIVGKGAMNIVTFKRTSANGCYKFANL